MSAYSDPLLPNQDTDSSRPNEAKETAIPAPADAIESDQSWNAATEEERFELLSAYIDHEASDLERRTVEAWLAKDAKARKLYQRLLIIRRAIKASMGVKKKRMASSSPIVRLAVPARQLLDDRENSETSSLLPDYPATTCSSRSATTDRALHPS